ncbi:MAG: MFS transporter [Kiritimatiellae bacterium]|nr:MFS transporter [Kiritimatiellia bacterium]
MSDNQQKSINWVAVFTMFALYGMISFVTNLAAPMGNVWVLQKGIDGKAALGMMGNMMNFLAYLFMGIPAGKMLTKCGYKKTALIAIATGFVGVAIQFVSGLVPPAADGNAVGPFCVYLLGAFVCGFSVCMLNMVVNPMLNLLGGGGNKGNQLNLIGTTFNSLCGTLTPMLVGALVGEVTKATKVADVNLVMYIALAVFALAFVILQFIKIENPEATSTTEDIPVFAPLKYRHCLLGVIAIFMYVGIEVGIPGTMNIWLAANGGELSKLGAAKPAAVAGGVVGIYWLLMLVGRTIGAFIGGKVSSRLMMIVTTVTAIVLILIGTQTTGASVKMPVYTIKEGFAMAQVPLTALLFALCGLCTSIMWPSTFNLATEKLGKYTAAASGLFMVMVVGGGILPLVQNHIADALASGTRDAAGAVTDAAKFTSAFMWAYIVPVVGLAYMFVYAAFFSKVPEDFKVD